MLHYQSAAQATKKRIIVTYFTMKIIHTYLYITCNKKIIFAKKISYPGVGIHRLLHSSYCFLNTNTVLTRQLIRTARTLEAEWWQVCGGTWVREQRKMSQVLSAFGLLDFTMLRPVLAWRAFWNLWTVYFFNFPIFFRAVVNRGYWIRGHCICIYTVYAVQKTRWNVNGLIEINICSLYYIQARLVLAL
jgi:hypothetical protein